MSRELLINILGTLSQDDLLWLKDKLCSGDIIQSKRDTIEEYRKDIEEGIQQVNDGKYYSTEDVFRMCMEDETELETV